ncbi:uncharacterized protein A1O5_12594 [Cladophialophora psammophila CBS 110553]|uniref:Glycoside hydrolase family 3 C-terminal domain-containing protein n=1 Tax=Cladophialophora psammophila CBS 110553 TaxID=1182543 RepID=W9VKZ1_9EURO|nr:uncharacterized protein A1O5_12594 [Cladophialophora psammophila CBS 110553]EXJ56327.1 hypothetical protein A1O5_12594 [Cladophialophora psammophila CBS 110553]
MYSYSAINGVLTCADPYILQTIVREHWNWTGSGQYMASDCDAIENADAYHHYTATGLQDVADTLIAALALQAAEEAIVLIKNDGVLPISLPADTNTNIAIIGGWANATTEMLGSYSGIAPYLHSPLYALQQLPHGNVLSSNEFGSPNTWYWNDALAACKAADFIIVADGISNSDKAEEHDRYTIAWPATTLEPINLAASLGIPIIVFQMGGGQLDDIVLLSNPNVSAVLWGWYLGMAGGDALVNIITGEVALAGRLPITQHPANYVNQVAISDMGLRPNATSGNPRRIYKWYDNALRPLQRLLAVKGGATSTATLQLTLDSLARHDEQGNTVLYPGDYGLLLDVPTQAVLNFTLTGSPVVLDQWAATTNLGSMERSATHASTLSWMSPD